MSGKSIFFSVIRKADTNKLLELRNDKLGAKEYLQSILDNDEYSKAVEIFYKYAPMLYEELFGRGDFYEKNIFYGIICVDLMFMRCGAC